MNGKWLFSAATGAVLLPLQQVLAAEEGVVTAQWDGFTAALFATNITNENRILDPFAAWSQANRTKPRTVGVQLGVDF